MERGVSGDTAFICGRWPLDPSRATLVFIHGAGESSLLWQAQVQGLKARVNTVAVDLPGHGRSGGGARQTVPEYASVLVDFITSIQAPNPIPCGLSMGGAISQQLPLDYSGHFQAGIIVSSGARLRVLPSLFELILSDMHAYVDLIDRMGFCKKTPASVKQAFLEGARPFFPWARSTGRRKPRPISTCLSTENGWSMLITGDFTTTGASKRWPAAFLAATITYRS